MSEPGVDQGGMDEKIGGDAYVGVFYIPKITTNLDQVYLILIQV